MGMLKQIKVCNVKVNSFILVWKRLYVVYKQTIGCYITSAIHLILKTILSTERRIVSKNEH